MGFTQTLAECRDVAVAGGKAANLGRLIRAGFPVPDGFVVTTRAYRYARAQAGVMGGLPEEVAEEIRTAYRGMGGGSVAVRSSATAEDMAGASMAGQYETFLDIEGETALVEAVEKCWESLNAPRTQAYLEEHGIDPARVAMAVVVQRLVSADVAGVLFTANPNGGIGGGRGEMLVEASWGLGESVVSGRVQPDVLTLEGTTGRVLSATIADKRVELSAGSHAEKPVAEARRRQACLGGRDVHRLWQLGKRAERHFGSPQDLEWAIHAGELYLLQSRPITTLEEAEAYEEVLRETRQKLRAEAAKGNGPWVVHNLGETLPHPTPLTWSVVGRFMSGAGGYGEMYRMAGFVPSERAGREGFLERIAGRVYMDVARAPEMFSAGFPYGYDVELLKRSVDVSQAAPTVPRGTMQERAAAGRMLSRVDAKLRQLAEGYDRHLRGLEFVELERFVGEQRKMALGELSAEGLIDVWRGHEREVMDVFAPKSLMPSLISGMALGDLRAFLAEHFWEEDAEALAQELSSGGPANRTVVADAELYEVGTGTRTVEAWVAAHGHRAAGEFDLAAARWRERPAMVREMAARLAAGEGPLERHARQAEAVDKRVAGLRERLRWVDRARFDHLLDVVRRYVAFREDGKDFLMMGYAFLRELALEAGRRLDIGEDVFYLTREDLFDALRVGFAPYHLIERRKAAYGAEARVRLPRVIDAGAIERLGEAAVASGVVTRGGHKAFAVSTGEAVGPARIFHSPTDWGAGAGEIGKGYILVCPSTDPSWTPLFVNAAGLVLECGGALSHGAVVAREMGLPAVVLPEATRLFTDGEAVRVDGARGWVGKAEEAAPALAEVDEQDAHVPAKLIPPPPGRKERLVGRVRNVMAGVWLVFLLGFFLLLPKYVHDPAFRVMDAVLWPLVRGVGKWWTVVVIAVTVAVATLLLQKFGTDNRRLLEAKRRARLLKKEAGKLGAGTPRRAAMEGMAASVQWRVLLAAMVPVGILLGPMVMPFVWMKDRVEPAAWNAAAGSPVQVVALVDGEYTGPVEIRVPEGVKVGGEAMRTLPPIRKTLERLLALYRQPRVDPSAPWELQVAPDLAREQTAADLEGYLKEGIPPQAVAWQVVPPTGFNGAFPVMVVAGGPTAHGTVVLGDRHPPAPETVASPRPNPVRTLQIVYPRPNVARVFWRPFAMFGGKWGAWDAGWVWLYIVAYLPVLLVLRFLLRVA
jgi:pyruvate,water dikinase